VKPAEPPAAAAVKPAPTPVATAPVKAEPKPEPPPAPAPVKPAPPTVAKPAPAAASGPWLVEAGTYMNAAALKAAEGKIRALGYETQVANFKKTVRMTRLRIGSVPESELKEALARVRALSPEAFALPGKGGFTLYAGTFTSQQNLRQLSARLAGEGIKAEEEPVEMERTISLLRFGGFADQAAASEAAARARRSGIAAEVIQPR
jgi:cell division septation protein DedD